MSLYNFVLNNIKDTPDLLLATEGNINYNDLFNFYKQQEKIYPIQSFLNQMLNTSIRKVSSDSFQYELLNQKVKTLSLNVFEHLNK